MDELPDYLRRLEEAHGPKHTLNRVGNRWRCEACRFEVSIVGIIPSTQVDSRGMSRLLG